MKASPHVAAHTQQRRKPLLSVQFLLALEPPHPSLAMLLWPQGPQLLLGLLFSQQTNKSSAGAADAQPRSTSSHGAPADPTTSHAAPPCRTAQGL